MKRFLYIILLSLVAFCTKAQSVIQLDTVIGGLTCRIYLPDTYRTESTSQTHPIIMFLQGAGEWGTDPNSVTKNGVGHEINSGIWDGKAVNPTTGLTEKFIIICPLSDNGTGPISFDRIDGLFISMKSKFRVDPSCVALMGLSRGGGATWAFSIHLYSYNWSVYPPIPTFKKPVTLLSSIVSASSESNIFDPVVKFVEDGTFAWGFGDTLDKDSHAVATLANMDSIAKYTSPDRSKFTAYLCPSAPLGHGCWNGQVFDPSVRAVIDGHSMNIYENTLYERRGTVIPPTNTVSTGAVSSPICVTTVSGTSLSVHVNSTGTFTGNTYTVQMSDKNGSFVSPTTIGTKSSNLNSDNISCTVPLNTPTGTKYRIRTNSNSPAIIGDDNGADLTINLASGNVTPNSPQTIAQNSNGIQLTVNPTSTPTGIQWYDGGSVIPGATTLKYTPNLGTVGGHSITCHLSFACGSAFITNGVLITVVSTAPKRVYINPTGGGANLIGCDGSFKYNPGDSLVFREFINGVRIVWNRIYLHCINNVVLINEGKVSVGDYYGNSTTVQTVGGFVLDNCTNIHLTGTGTAGITYGFLDSSNAKRGVGIDLVGITNNIELDHVEIYHRNTGIWDKTEQLDNKCYDSLAFPQLVMHSHNIHDLYIHAIVNEGMYIGSTAPNSNDTSVNNQHPKVYCPDGTLNTTLTARMGDIHVHHNIIDSTGRGAIQLASADSGHNEIDHNTVTRSGYSGTYGQGNGIVIGGYTHADIHDNTVSSTAAAGIFSLGSGLVRIYNNRVDSSGIIRDGTHVTGAPNMEIDTRNVSNPSPGHANPELLTFQLLNNILLNKTSTYNVVLDKTYNTYAPLGSYICNSGNSIYNGNNVPYSPNCGVQASITVGTMATKTFCVSNSIGASFVLPITSVGDFNPENEYQVQLSDNTGSFVSPVKIGSKLSVLNSENINCIIPPSTLSGSGFKLRVISTSPALISDTVSSITITLTDNSISPSTQQDILTGTNGDVLTVIETTTAISRQWLKNGVAITGQTGTTFAPNFPTAGSYNISCKTSYSCWDIISNVVVVVVSDPPPPPPQTISLGAVSLFSPYCVKTTVTILLPFTSMGAFLAGNQYKAILSNRTGSFSSGTTVGFVTTTANSGTITVTIDTSINTGTGYRLRIVSTSPKVISDTTSAITFNIATNSISPIDSQFILTSANGNILAKTEKSTHISGQWYVDGIATGVTTSTYTPHFDTARVYTLTYHSVFSCGEVISKPVVVTVTDSYVPPPLDTIICDTNHSWHHDSLISVTYHKIVQVPVYTDTTICKHVWFLWMKFTIGCTSYHNFLIFRDSAYDSIAIEHIETPIHDTVICDTINRGQAMILYSNPYTSFRSNNITNKMLYDDIVFIKKEDYVD